MTDLEGYKFEFRKQEATLLAERKKLLGQKQLLARIFTSEAARQRAALEQAIAQLERRIIEIRRCLGENYKNN